jgi:hypothetical protein
MRFVNPKLCGGIGISGFVIMKGYPGLTKYPGMIFFPYYILRSLNERRNTA